MREVEPLKGLCRRSAGQDDFMAAPLHQPHLHKVSYEPGDCLSLEVQPISEGARSCRLFGSGNEDKCSDVALADRHSLLIGSNTYINVTLIQENTLDSGDRII